MRKFLIVSPLSTILLLGSVWAQDATPPQQPVDQSSQAAPDNTAKNQRDRNQSEPTADKQKENKPDRELAHQIQKAFVKDKSLSTYAHNIKVVTQNSAVTLTGPVKSAY